MQRTTHATNAAPARRPRGLRAAGPMFACAIVVLGGLCYWAFQPALDASFLNWDDNINLVENPMIRGLDATHVGEMFTKSRLGHYQPLTWLSYAVDHAVGGLSPRGVLRTNIVLHGLAALACYAVASLLLQAAWGGAASEVAVRVGALFAAAVFAVHPLRAESVAWATERRDVLSGLFYLAAIWIYMRSVWASPNRRPTLAGLALCFGVFGAALLSKVMSVSLPAVLLVLDVYPLRRVRAGELLLTTPAGRRVWLEKLPFFAVGLAVAAIAVAAQSQTTSVLTFAEYGVGPRLVQSLYSLAFYVTRTIVPVALGPLYELPAAVSLGSSRFLLPALFVAAVSVVLLLLRRRWPAGLAAWVAYGLVLIPVSGLFQNGPQITADRYSYLSCIALAVLVGGGAARLCMVRAQARREFALFVLVVGALGIMVLAALARRQTRVWHDSFAVWSRAVAVEPAGVFANNMLGELLADRGALDAARSCFQTSLRGKPKYAQALHNLGNVHLRQNKPADALSAYQDALAAYEQTGANAERIAKTQHQIGSTLFRLGRLDEAAAAFSAAVEADPQRLSTYANLGTALLALNRPADAARVLRRARAIQSDDVNVNRALAWVLATSAEASVRDGKVAVALAEAADRAEQGRNVAVLQTLAAAYAEAGRFDNAVATIDRAVTLANAKDDKGPVAGLLQQRALYQSHRPFRTGQN